MKKKKVAPSGQRTAKGLLVAQNQTVIPDTRLCVPPAQTKIAEGPDLDRGLGLGQEVLGQVPPTPDQKDPEEIEGHGLTGPTITTLSADPTGALHVEIEGALAPGLKEPGTVLTLMMITGRTGQE
jgi:hypothetical protein